MMYNLTKTSATKSTYYRKVKLLVSLLIILSSFVLGKGFAGIGSDVPFSFTLQTDARTSAGVYTKDGVLIRTLWSGVSYKAGTYAMSWDGKDDYGHLYADGSYDVKVVSNNITATWDGVIGNSSGQLTGPSVHRGWETIRTMTATGNTLYYAKGYSEGSPSQTKFSSVTPQAKTSLLTSSGTGQATLFSATDGVNVYWAGYDAFAAVADSWFVFATKVADDSEYVFPKGAPYQVTRGYKYKSSIAAVEDVAVTGLAVQKGGNYLFIAYQDVNAILAFNKTTGEYIKTIELGAPVGNICVDKNDNLWVVLGSNKVQKYTAKADGSLLATTLSITGLSSPQALAVSPDGTTLLVADAADSQQLKAFSTTTAAPSWTYGRKGGYATDATVTNDKFYFLMGDTGRNAYLTYQADGSFWVGDSGNFRALHFSASRSLLDCVMYVPTCYSSSVDGTNPSRVFAGFLEFAVDYSKSLGGTNGSWKLVKNWGATVPDQYLDQFSILKGVATLSNGRTYATLNNATTSAVELVELVNNGLLRLTGVVVSPKAEGATTQLYPDGSLRRTYRMAVGQAQKFTRKPLTGFDGANNPLWGSETTLATTPLTTSDDPLYYGNTIKLRAGEVTASGVVVAFDGSKASTKYHLGGIRLSDNKWLWRTAVNTHWAYTGAYPADGSYDVGNGVNTTGIAQQVNGRVILWGYHGEFWKASQTNKYQLVYDNGLFLGSFGTTGHDTGIESLPVPPVGMAGNAFSGSLVKVGDDLYYYHNDENYHSGIHRWKIAGLNTIQEQVIPIANPATLATKNTSSKNGLTGYYFNSGDLNNLLLKTTRVDAQLNFNWGSAVPNGASLSDASNYSVRWRGFLKTGYSEAYTLYIKAAKGVRVWIDDTLYLNKWTNNSLSEQKFSLPMVASERYAIRIETQASSAISLSWSSAHQTKEIIPASALFPNTDSEELTAKDLLSGLTYCGVLADGLYGWKRNPVAEDYTNANKDWWQAVSGRKSYRQQSADLWVKYRQASGSYSVTRDLGVVNNASSWSLTGRISYEDNEGNNSGGGCYLEVLDKNGKVIARTYMNISYAGDKSITLFGNTAQLATGPSAVMNSIVDRIQPLSIVGSSSGITFSYAGYKPVTTSIFDASSDWRSPKSMRLLFIGGNDNGNTYNRIINIQSMQFAATSTAQSRVADAITDVVEVKLKVYPNPSQDVLNVEHAAIVDAGSISIFATDGQKVESYSLQNGSTSTTLNINSLSPGVYLLQYENGSTRSITRFIKQ